MFGAIFRFELRFWLRSWMLWIFLLVIALMVYGAASSDHITIGGALQNTHRNAPFVIQTYYTVCCLLALLMTTAFVNSAATRDFTANTYQMIFTQPIRKRDYLLGRFAGSAIVAVIPLLGVSLGMIVARWTTWLDIERWGPIDWPAHAKSVLVFAIPNTIFVAAILFAVAILSPPCCCWSPTAFRRHFSMTSSTRRSPPGWIRSDCARSGWWPSTGQWRTKTGSRPDSSRSCWAIALFGWA